MKPFEISQKELREMRLLRQERLKCTIYISAMLILALPLEIMHDQKVTFTTAIEQSFGINNQVTVVEKDDEEEVTIKLIIAMFFERDEKNR